MAQESEDFESIRKVPPWLLVFFSNMFFGCAGFSIVLPTLWAYLRAMKGTPEVLACAVAMYSIGEGLGGLVCGQLLGRYPSSSKRILMSSMCIGLIAAVLYSVAELFGNEVGKQVVLATRFFSGFDNGARQTLQQTVIAQAVPARSQTTVSSRVGSFAVTGIMLGPALGAMFQSVFFVVPGIGLTVDGNNGPGLVLALTCVMAMLTTSRFFHPDSLGMHKKAEKHAGVDDPACTAPRPSRVGLLTCYTVFALANLVTAAMETMTPIVSQQLFGWGPCLHPETCPFAPQRTYINLLLTCGGLLSLAMSLMVALYVGRLIYDREITFITFGLIVYTVTNTMNVDFGGHLPAWRFVASYLTGAFLGAMMRGPNISLLTQVIGPRPQGNYMGLLFAVGAFPRIVSPFIMVRLLVIPTPLQDVHFQDVYDGPLPRTWLLYGCQALLFGGMALAMLAARGPIRKHVLLLRSRAEALKAPLLPAAQAVDDDGKMPFATPIGMQEGLEVMTMRSIGSQGKSDGSPTVGVGA